MSDIRHAGIAVILHTSIYRGDHAADAAIPQELVQGEMVGEIVERLLDPRRRSGHEKYTDWIEVRYIEPATGEEEAGP